MTEAQPAARKVSVREFLQIFSAVMLPMFLAAIDQTMLATATPAIAVDLGDLADTSWIAVAYLLATAVTAPFYGRLGDRYGRGFMLRIAVCLFALGSVVCALAGNMAVLALARALQGAGGGGLMVMSQALIGELVPPRERGRFQGYFGSVFTLASVTGPVLGGYVVAQASWPWLFWINVPLCAFALWRLSKVAPVAPDSQTGAQMSTLNDMPGALWFTVAATTALLWVSFGGHRFAWLSPTSAALGLATLLMWWGLIRRERRLAAPFLPMELLRDPSIRLIAGTVACFTWCMFSLLFFLPTYLQLGHGASATNSGLLLLPLTLGIVTGSTATGRYVSRTGKVWRVPTLGLGWSAINLLLLGLLPATPWLVGVLGYLIGMGFGTVMPSAQLIVQTAAGRDRLGAAAATIALSRSLGSAVGTALFGTVVFGLLKGLDLEVVLRNPVDTPLVIHAFHACFIGTAFVAAFGAWLASRLPKLTL